MYPQKRQKYVTLLVDYKVCRRWVSIPRLFLCIFKVPTRKCWTDIDDKIDSR